MSQRLVSCIGLICIIFLAWAFSTNRKHVSWRTVFGGLSLQFLFALLILKTSLGSNFFEYARHGVNTILELSNQGSVFLFGDEPANRNFAFRVLPTVIFISALSSLLFYWKFIPRAIQSMSYVMQKCMNITAVESLLTGANIFLGQIESALFIRPYLKSMTLSEIHTMMTVGMAMTSGVVISAYVSFGISAGHLITASVMSAPGAIYISKLLLPELHPRPHHKEAGLHVKKASNIFEAACKGASEGLMLALNIGAMLIAFIAIIAFINLGLGKIGGLLGLTLSFEGLVGYLFQPFAFLIGIPWAECQIVGKLLGEKTVLNEFIAFLHLSDLMKSGALSERTVIICTYALCGFANFSSVAMQIGGIGALEESRKADLAKCGLRAMFGGTLASLSSAAIAGILF